MSKMTPKEVKVYVGEVEKIIRPFVLRNRDKFIAILISLLKNKDNLFSGKGSGIENLAYVAEKLLEKGQDLNQMYFASLRIEENAEEQKFLLDNLIWQQEKDLLKAIWEVNDFDFLLREVEATGTTDRAKKVYKKDTTK